MKKSCILWLFWSASLCFGGDGPRIELAQDKLEPVSVAMTAAQRDGKDCIQVVKDASVRGPDQPTFAKIKGAEFKDGVIRVKALSNIAKNARGGARGFIGVAFRINDDNSKFECIYLRPANARSEDQLRRNHSVQYFSYPDHKFMVLRRETPGKYESYTDMGLNEWIDIKIEVKGSRAALYLNGSDQPCLIVNDLKHGPNLSGSVGLWVDGGTEGLFTDLSIQ